MRSLLQLLGLVYFSLVGCACAESAVLAWDANPEPDIAGYVVTIKRDGESIEIDVPGKIETPADILPGDVLTVRAYNTAGFHGPDSDPLTITRPEKSTGLAVRITVQTSSDLQDKKTVFEATVPLDSGDPSQFIESKAEIIPIEPSK